MSLVGSGGGKQDRHHKGEVAVGALFGWCLHRGGSKQLDSVRGTVQLEMLVDDM